MTCLGVMFSYVQPEAINLKSSHWFQFGSLHAQRHISMYVLMFKSPGSIRFSTHVSSMSSVQCLDNEALVVRLAQNSVENAAIVPLSTCCFVHKLSVSGLHSWVVDNFH